MSFCMHCGSKLNEGARFCAKCGNPTTAPAPEPAPIPAPAPIHEPTPAPAPIPVPTYTPAPVAFTPADKKSGNALCVILSVLLVLQAAAVALFGWPGFLADKDESGITADDMKPVGTDTATLSPEDDDSISYDSKTGTGSLSRSDDDAGGTVRFEFKRENGKIRLTFYMQASNKNGGASMTASGLKAVE